MAITQVKLFFYRKNGHFSFGECFGGSKNVLLGKKDWGMSLSNVAREIKSLQKYVNLRSTRLDVS